ALSGRVCDASPNPGRRYAALRLRSALGFHVRAFQAQCPGFHAEGTQHGRWRVRLTLSRRDYCAALPACSKTISSTPSTLCRAKSADVIDGRPSLALMRLPSVAMSTTRASADFHGIASMVMVELSWKLFFGSRSILK